MVRQYKYICREHGCKAKAFTQMGNGLRAPWAPFTIRIRSPALRRGAPDSENCSISAITTSY